MKHLALVALALSLSAAAQDPSSVWRGRPNQGIPANCPSCNLVDSTASAGLVDAGTVNATVQLNAVGIDAGVVMAETSLQFGGASTNHATLAGATTGNPVTLTVDASSGDTNAGIDLAAKGTGTVRVTGSGGLQVGASGPSWTKNGGYMFLTGASGLQLISQFQVSNSGSLTAHAGGGQASALQLAAEFNVVTTVATAADSVALPDGITGETIAVVNAANASRALAIFPKSGGSIDSLGANIAYSLAGSTGPTIRHFRCVVAPQTWVSF